MYRIDIDTEGIPSVQSHSLDSKCCLYMPVCCVMRIILHMTYLYGKMVSVKALLYLGQSSMEIKQILSHITGQLLHTLYVLSVTFHTLQVRGGPFLRTGFSILSRKGISGSHPPTPKSFHNSKVKSVHQLTHRTQYMYPFNLKV